MKKISIYFLFLGVAMVMLATQDVSFMELLFLTVGAALAFGLVLMLG